MSAKFHETVGAAEAPPKGVRVAASNDGPRARGAGAFTFGFATGGANIVASTAVPVLGLGHSAAADYPLFRTTLMLQPHIANPPSARWICPVV